jgi:hypothetical protein
MSELMKGLINNTNKESNFLFTNNRKIFDNNKKEAIII